MSQVAVLHNHMSSQRDTWWYLVQDGDGQLYVEHENDDDLEAGKTRVPINEFLTSSHGGAKSKLQERIDLMFKE